VDGGKMADPMTPLSAATTMPTSRELLTLSREDLYELVWSKPKTEVARDFGLSDVALAKRCRKLGVPVPGRGLSA
jgi:hypothetical protein